MKSFVHKLGTQAMMTFVMLLLTFAPFVTLTAQAQQSCGTPGANAATCIPSGSAAATPSATPNTAPTAQQQQTSTDVLASCRNIEISGCIASMVYVFTVGIGSAFAYIAAYFFDITIQLSLQGASYGLDFVSTSWTTARDLANMAFLFILIYIAFTIILRADTSGTMSLLAGVIIVALLVNFSFFFSRLAIDAGNILSIQFYNAIPAPPMSQTISGTPVAGTVASAVQTAGNTVLSNPGNAKDLTASIMNMIQVQNLLNNQSFSAANGGSSFSFNLVATLFIFIAAAIVLWLLTVAFITNGVKFLVRVVVLWFLIIVSPFAFVAAAVQGTGGYFKQWRELLLTHAFYPVAFMFIFLILNNFAITISGGSTNLVSGVFATGTGAQTWSAIGASLVSVAIRVGLVIAVLFVGLRASDRISVYGASAASKAGNWFGGKFIGAYGAVGRNTVGRAAYNISQRPGFQTAAANNSLVGALWRGTNRVSKSTFDVRTPLKAAGVKDVVGINMAGANKGGFKGAVDARIKAREEQAKQFNGLNDEQKKIIEDNVKAATAGDLEKARVGKSAADTIQNEAQIKFDEAKKEEDRLNREIEKADDEIEKLKNMKKENTPEMEKAHGARDQAKNRLDVQKGEVVSREKELNISKKETQTFSSKIVDLNKKIQDTIKTEQNKNTPKNIFADSIAGKNGIMGNMSRLGWIPTADKKAAEKIRKEKSSKDKIADAVKDLQKEEDAGKEEKKDEPAATKPEDKK